MLRRIVRIALGALAVGAAIALGALVVLLVAVASGVVGLYVVPTPTMQPTLQCARPRPGCEGGRNERVAVLRRFTGYDRGDIVVFQASAAAERACGIGGAFVKRIVGLPGETVEIRVVGGAGHVLVDGRRLDEPYVRDDLRGEGPALAVEVPRGSFFVLGDNRVASCDSRAFGVVREGTMTGRVVLTVWPPSRITFH